MSPVWAPDGSLEQSWPPSSIAPCHSRLLDHASAGSPAGRCRACPRAPAARDARAAPRRARPHRRADRSSSNCRSRSAWAKACEITRIGNAPGRRGACLAQRSAGLPAPAATRSHPELAGCRHCGSPAYIVAAVGQGPVQQDGAARTSKKPTSPMLNVLRKQAGSWVVKVLLAAARGELRDLGHRRRLLRRRAESDGRQGRQLGDRGERADGSLQPLAQRAAAPPRRQHRPRAGDPARRSCSRRCRT